MFKFITKKPLWLNILVGLLLAVGIFSAFISSLGWLTHHDDAKTVPPTLGKTMHEAKQILEQEGFQVEIQDSIYIDSLKPLQVIRQVPDEYEVVKSNRTVYLTINRAVPPMVQMPNIVGYSFRNAELTLKNLGLKVGDTTFKPDFAKNSVLEQLYNGVPIQPGAQIRMGSSISLIIGDGLSAVAVPVPDLRGLTFAEASSLLSSKGISLGAVIADPGVRDTTNAYVYKQNPERKDEEGYTRTIRAGQLMDIWISIERPVVDSSLLNFNNIDSTKEQ